MGSPLKTMEWKKIMEDLKVGRSAFYAMRNKLLGAGLISNRGGEYRLSGVFSHDLVDMARWWWTAVLGKSPDSL
jgi:predicted transcriptional regulator